MTLISVVAFATWANHCILGDVFASSTTQKQQSSHCHGDESPESGNHHSECQDQGCCQPAVQASHSIDNDALSFVIASVPAIVVAAFNPPVLIDSSALIRAATGPPLRLFEALYDLSIAPNAPPRF